tara:strand:+ start:2703 stop:3506 length:804 start_codon:yes stop_codon:yes gene_type:complete
VTAINITLETLYDVLRNEKKNEELQELEKTFFLDVVSYMREKKVLLESRKDEDELFATSERKKLDYEMRSIKRILKEIYEKREKKIIAIALNKSRTGSSIIDTSYMLPEEKEFFSLVVEHFDTFRRGILLQLWRAELPLIQSGSSVLQRALAEEKETKAISNSFESDSISGIRNQEESTTKSTAKLTTKSTTDEEAELTSSDEETDEIDNEVEEESKLVVRIKFIHPVPRFLWKDMKEYGPYESGDETDIFPEIADLLERKGRAEKV